MNRIGELRRKKITIEVIDDCYIDVPFESAEQIYELLCVSIDSKLIQIIGTTLDCDMVRFQFHDKTYGCQLEMKISAHAALGQFSANLTKAKSKLPSLLRMLLVNPSVSVVMQGKKIQVIPFQGQGDEELYSTYSICSFVRETNWNLCRIMISKFDDWIYVPKRRLFKLNSCCEYEFEIIARADNRGRVRYHLATATLVAANDNFELDLPGE
ncbi:MAG: hypothetical protein ABF335_09735 [Alphaproteobacteria bacterium]